MSMVFIFFCLFRGIFRAMCISKVVWSTVHPVGDESSFYGSSCRRRALFALIGAIKP